MRNLLRALAVALALLPVPARALECLEATIQRQYWWYKARPEAYVLALGRFTNITLVEDVRSRETAEGWVEGRAVFQAEFEGFRASRRAFDQPFAIPARLVFPDYDYIAGGSQSSGIVERLPEMTGLVWFRQTEAGYEATDGLCSPIIDVDPASVRPALRCRRGGHCPKPD